MKKTKHNPERTAWRGRSHCKGGERISELREAVAKTSSTEVVEECFECYIEAIEGAELRLRTVSSSGEEAIATMPLSAVPLSERPYVELGTSLRVTILRSYDGNQVRREQQVCLLPSQCKAPRVETLPLQRVELHPGTDAWMRGDRFGTTLKLDKIKKLVHVKMDRSGRILRLAPENVLPI